ncbi:unnamed protein product [Urochloa humidicola]
MGNRWDVIPADIFMDILQRIPASPRRRLRLVCRHWRDVIDGRTPVPIRRLAPRSSPSSPRTRAAATRTSSTTSRKDGPVAGI